MQRHIAEEPLQTTCDHYDVKQVHAVARYLLRTLAAACVEKTYGDLFKSPLSALDEAKRELLQFLLHYTEPPSPPSPPAFSGLPVDCAKSLLDQFVSSKTKLLSRVCSKLISNDKKIEKLEQDLQQNERWIFGGQRECLAKDLLLAVDRTKSPVCAMTFTSQEDLAEHKNICPFRPVTCENDGCGHVFSAMHGAEHDAVCGFKLLPCEQECDALVMRSEMDEHCATTCSMKLVNCPFFNVGCKDVLPQGMVEEHCTKSKNSHILSILEYMQLMISNLAFHVQLLKKALSICESAGAVDSAKLSLALCEQEAKIMSLEKTVGNLQRHLKASIVLSDAQKSRSEMQTWQKKIEGRVNEHL